MLADFVGLGDFDEKKLWLILEEDRDVYVLEHFDSGPQDLRQNGTRGPGLQDDTSCLLP